VSADLVTSPADTAATAIDLRAMALDLSAEASPVEAPVEAGGEDAPIGESSSEAGCSGWAALKRLSPAEVADLVATSDPIVINVHIPYAGDIPGTDTSIPYNNVDAIEAYLNYDHCADVLLICMSGGMSQSAGNELVKRGYLRVRDLNGGMDAWQKAGYTLVKDGGT
jgi:rhodanese-related sulfurtransferase